MLDAEAPQVGVLRERLGAGAGSRPPDRTEPGLLARAHQEPAEVVALDAAS
jgi:hypothetical protein